MVTLVALANNAHPDVHHSHPTSVSLPGERTQVDCRRRWRRSFAVRLCTYTTDHCHSTHAQLPRLLLLLRAHCSCLQDPRARFWKGKEQHAARGIQHCPAAPTSPNLARALKHHSIASALQHQASVRMLRHAASHSRKGLAWSRVCIACLMKVLA